MCVYCKFIDSWIISLCLHPPIPAPSDAVEELCWCCPRSPLTEDDVASERIDASHCGGNKRCVEQNCVLFLANTQTCSLTVFLSLFPSSVLCLVYINIKALIEVHLLSNITYTHLQVRPTLSRPSQTEPAADRHHHCVTTVAVWRLPHCNAQSSHGIPFISRATKGPLSISCVSAFVCVCHE